MDVPTNIAVESGDHCAKSSSVTGWSALITRAGSVGRSHDVVIPAEALCRTNEIFVPSGEYSGWPSTSGPVTIAVAAPVRGSTV